jgi:sec-independent protein translocase protein TatC
MRKTGNNSNEELHMTVGEHIVELRRRVITVLILFLLFMVLGFVWADEVVLFLKEQPVAAQIPWVVLGLADAFKVYFLFSIAVALVLTFPFALYQVWAFVSPGLTPKERRVTLSFIPAAVLLFLVGLAFGYFWLFPFMVQFMMGLAERLGAQEMYGMIHYFQFLITFVVPFGFVFQMPILVLFLTRLGVISPDLLRRIRKYAYFILFVIAAMITPPDVVSHLLVTIPLVILYEISIWLSRLGMPKAEELSITEEQEG